MNKLEKIPCPHAYIGLINDDGTVSYVGLLNDPHLGGAGIQLHVYYRTIDKIKELLSFGDIYTLQRNITPTPGKKHKIFGMCYETDHYQRDVCLFYNRDGAEGEQDARFEQKAFPSINEYINEVMTNKHIIYSYLHDGYSWFMIIDGKLVRLTDLFESGKKTSELSDSAKLRNLLDSIEGLYQEIKNKSIYRNNKYR